MTEIVPRDLYAVGRVASRSLWVKKDATARLLIVQAMDLLPKDWRDLDGEPNPLLKLAWASSRIWSEGKRLWQTLGFRAALAN
jgi:hypothetical protein